MSVSQRDELSDDELSVLDVSCMVYVSYIQHRLFDSCHLTLFYNILYDPIGTQNSILSPTKRYKLGRNQIINKYYW